MKLNTGGYLKPFGSTKRPDQLQKAPSLLLNG